VCIGRLRQTLRRTSRSGPTVYSTEDGSNRHFRNTGPLQQDQSDTVTDITVRLLTAFCASAVSSRCITDADRNPAYNYSTNFARPPYSYAKLYAFYTEYIFNISRSYYSQQCKFGSITVTVNNAQQL
jgi:hypothetical protein